MSGAPIRLEGGMLVGHRARPLFAAKSALAGQATVTVPRVSQARPGSVTQDPVKRRERLPLQGGELNPSQFAVMKPNIGEVVARACVEGESSGSPVGCHGTYELELSGGGVDDQGVAEGGSIGVRTRDA